jgi:8-oxo-dGTP pyrophosphatase MutT (NUDIX family)
MKKTISAGGIIINSKNQIVLVYHGKGNWNFPKGHVEKGETLEETARREIAEESGITKLELIKPLGNYSRFRIGEDGITEKKDELKTMHFFLFKSDQIKLKPTDPINSKAKWVDINEVPNYLKHPKDIEFLEKVKKDLEKE